MTDRQTVLIVDDSPEDREIYRHYLLQDRERHYTIWEEGMGARGLALCQKLDPDCILLDYALPDMDGLEFLAALKNGMGNSQPAVIMLTGQGDEKVAVRAIKNGAQDYLVKDQTTFESLSLTVSTAIANVQLRQQLQRAQESLRSSQLFLQSLADATPGFLYLYDLVEQRNVYTNDRITQLLGYTPAAIQVMGKELFLNIMHPEDLARIPVLLQRFEVAKDGEFLETEYRLRRSDGEWRWFFDRSVVFSRNPDGSVRQVLGTALDVTERQQAQERLRREAERSQLLAEISQQIWQSLNLPEILGTVVEGVRHWLQTDRVIVFQLESDLNSGTVVRESVGSGWTRILSTTLTDPCLSKSYVETYRRGLATTKTDIYTAGIDPCHLELLAKLQVRANLVVPILQNELLWGLLIAHHCSAPREWQPEEIDLLRQLATQVGIAIQQTSLLEKLQIELGQRQEMEKALRLSNDRFRQAARAVNCLIYDWDVESDTVIRTEGLSKVVGYSLAEAEPTGAWWRQLIHPDDLAQIMENFDSTLQNKYSLEGDRYLTEYRVRHKQGHYLWVQDRGLATRDAEGRLSRIVGSTWDITERKQAEESLRQSEESFRLLAENMPQMVWTTLPDGKCNYWNEQLCDFTGLRLEQARDFKWLSILHPDDVESCLDAWMKAVVSGQPFEAEIRYRTKTGDYRWVLSRALPLKDERGQIVKWLGTSTDIDDRKQFEKERSRLLERERLARSEAEAANRAKDEFVAVVSHELRTPLNAIMGWAKILRTRRLDEAKTAQALETIERNVKDQAKLIEDLLDISRLIRGKLELQSRQLNLAALIKVAVETALPSAQAKSISLESVGDEAQMSIWGDATRLQQILGNLLTNAIKFTPEGGRVEVRLERVEGEGERGREGEERAVISANRSVARISVSDTGQGIKPEFLPRIFDRYSQENGIKKHQGLGLGLAIARSLVELHQGQISAFSAGEGRGATFTILLPIKE
ncbi:MAG: PAS domain-containing protein [Cyanosarcina radialis HA8281-LM2]|nr:PAS domain-containing protein [Cyanosarcina radialis HA8281-LM2]